MWLQFDKFPDSFLCTRNMTADVILTNLTYVATL